MTFDEARRSARAPCQVCGGSGFAFNAFCNCVLHRVFNTCLSRYRTLAPERHSDPKLWQADYRADFHAAAIRALPQKHLYSVFTFLYIHEGTDRQALTRFVMSPGMLAKWKQDISLAVAKEILKIEGAYALYKAPEEKKKNQEVSE